MTSTFNNIIRSWVTFDPRRNLFSYDVEEVDDVVALVAGILFFFFLILHRNLDF